jgi:hypothetical protein
VTISGTVQILIGSIVNPDPTYGSGKFEEKEGTRVYCRVYSLVHCLYNFLTQKNNSEQKWLSIRRIRIPYQGSTTVRGGSSAEIESSDHAL